MEKEIHVAETQEEAVQLLEKELEIAPMTADAEVGTTSDSVNSEIASEDLEGAPFGGDLVYKFENFEFVVDSIQEDGQYLAHRKDSANKCLLTLENDKIVKISYLSV